MKLWHLAGLPVTSALVVLSMLLPFLPGAYDAVAVWLSFLAQGVAWAGVLLVPLGMMWLAYELGNRTKGVGAPRGRDTGYWLAMASIGALTVIVLFLAMGAFVSGGFPLAIGTIVLWTFCARRLTSKVMAMSRAEMRSFNAAPLYLVVVPLSAAIVRMALLGPASEFSRNRAIENSAALIRDIERYRERPGRYPQSLMSVHGDYEPSVIGVERYHYEPNGDAYNVYFEHLSSAVGTREFVMYNKRDEHEMTSHDMDLLLVSPTALPAHRGYYAVHNASRPHWKRFLFD